MSRVAPSDGMTFTSFYCFLLSVFLLFFYLLPRLFCYVFLFFLVLSPCYLHSFDYVYYIDVLFAFFFSFFLVPAMLSADFSSCHAFCIIFILPFPTMPFLFVFFCSFRYFSLFCLSFLSCLLYIFYHAYYVDVFVCFVFFSSFSCPCHAFCPFFVMLPFIFIGCHVTGACYPFFCRPRPPSMGAQNID